MVKLPSELTTHNRFRPFHAQPKSAPRQIQEKALTRPQCMRKAAGLASKNGYTRELVRAVKLLPDYVARAP
jgi:hypothetical protein